MTLFFRWFRKRSSASVQQVPAGPPPRQACRPAHRPQGRPNGAPAYVLVVDESGATGSSFRMAGGRMTSRMAAIQSAARGYLQRLRDANPGQRVSIVGFSDAAHLYHRLAPVGPAFGGLCQALGALHPQSTTNLCAGLALALDQLARGRVRLGHVVIITDGGANVGQGRLPGLLNRARAAHVRIFTIGVGNNADPDYDRRLLVKIASDTRARFASADSFGQLCQALSRVA